MHVGQQAGLLVSAVIAVGVLHTMVPDHWAPIALLARQQGWTKRRTARAAAIAGFGHTVSTLIIAVIVWAAGALLAMRFGHLLNLASSIALIAFGSWIAISSWRELRGSHGHDHAHFGHAHLHWHAGGLEHRHWHEHHAHDWHSIEGALALTPVHEHEHETSSRTALLLILGSSPMIEGIPAFFAAGRYGAPLLALMAVLFALSTIATYVALCVASASGMQRFNLGRFEEYGEVISGALIAAIGAAFLILPIS
jgi:ABC-type nickel/cobalt efflux system permease component RcnA